MHSAPSVNYPVGRSRYAECLLGGLWGLGAVCAALACVQYDGFDWRPALLAASVAVTGIAAWAGVARTALPVELSFDGQSWSVAGGAGLQAARARVALDLQSLVLVELIAQGGARRWLWVDGRAMPERWRDLRRALHARTASLDVPPAARGVPGA